MRVLCGFIGSTIVVIAVAVVAVLIGAMVVVGVEGRVVMTV